MEIFLAIVYESHGCSTPGIPLSQLFVVLARSSFLFLDQLSLLWLSHIHISCDIFKLISSGDSLEIKLSEHFFGKLSLNLPYQALYRKIQ